MTDRFIINDLPNGTYSVTWPGYERNVVNNPGKVLKLLEILFDVVGVDEAMIGVQESGRDNDWHTMHISNFAWLDVNGRKRIAQRLAEYVIPGVRFTDVYQAEKFKAHMEKLLVWARLSNGQSWE